MRKCRLKEISTSHSAVSDSLWSHGLYSPWNSPGQTIGVGSISLLQEIFPTQGLNPGLLNCRQILYQLSHKGSSRVLEWVAYPFSKGSSRPRNRNGVSCIAGRFFTNWATRESLAVNTGINPHWGSKRIPKVFGLWTSSPWRASSWFQPWLRACL